MSSVQAPVQPGTCTANHVLRFRCSIKNLHNFAYKTGIDAGACIVHCYSPGNHTTNITFPDVPSGTDTMSKFGLELKGTQFHPEIRPLFSPSATWRPSYSVMKKDSLNMICYVPTTCLFIYLRFFVRVFCSRKHNCCSHCRLRVKRTCITDALVNSACVVAGTLARDRWSWLPQRYIT